jgi:hypothetical protein
MMTVAKQAVLRFEFPIVVNMKINCVLGHYAMWFGIEVQYFCCIIFCL